MKLTATQIGVVRGALVSNDDLYGESRCTALELANAYERVAALRTELADFMESSNARPKLAIEDVLRKLDAALEG